MPPSLLSESFANFSAAARAFFSSFLDHFGLDIVKTGIIVCDIVAIVPRSNSDTLCKEFTLSLIIFRRDSTWIGCNVMTVVTLYLYGDSLEL